MSEDNPYSAPISQLENQADPQGALNYYTVSRFKFWVLFIGTAGLYQIGWMYRHWQGIKRAEGLEIQPVLRGVFSVFFFHALGRNISKRGQLINYPHTNALRGLATYTVIAIVARSLISAAINQTTITPLTLIILLLIEFVSVPFIWQIQAHANYISGDTQGKRNNRFSPGNILWIIFGMALTALSVYLAFFPIPAIGM